MNDGDVTRLLVAVGSGDRAAFDRFYQAVYSELHRIAIARMRREGKALTLQPTALVNETYLRLLPSENAFENRRHFFAAAAEAMRRILVDHARQRQSQKRGGEFERITLTGLDVALPEQDMDVLLVDEAVEELAIERPRLAQLVSLRFFAGLGIEDAAAALEISPATAKRDWAFARAWLHDRIEARRNEL
jgi:RNA polymerase sigma factor (TIGR02999 family)